MNENRFIENILPEAIETMPLASFPGEICVIDSLSEDYRRAVRYLKRQKILGFDTETKPCFRIKSLGMQRALCNILANPDIVKVGAATTDDVRGLQRYAKFKPASFVDLQKIVPEWGIRDKSVKKMAAIILGVKVSKTQQLSNWEADTLSEPQMKYAATDAWICREMYLKLKNTELKPLAPTTVAFKGDVVSVEIIENKEHIW